jgi:hypothetical protein
VAYFLLFVSIVTSVFTLTNVVAMWNYRAYVKYIYFNAVLTIGFCFCLLTATMVLNMDLDQTDCRFYYVGSKQMKQFIAVSSSSLPAVSRLVSKDFRQRVYRVLTNTPEPCQNITVRSTENILNNSFACGGEGNVMKFSEMNITGAYKSLTAKVTLTQFIIDSLIGISAVFRPQASIQPVHSVTNQHETVIDFKKCHALLKELELGHLTEDNEHIRVIAYQPKAFATIRASQGLSDEDIAE